MFVVSECRTRKPDAENSLPYVFPPAPIGLVVMVVDSNVMLGSIVGWSLSVYLLLFDFVVVAVDFAVVVVWFVVGVAEFVVGVSVLFEVVVVEVVVIVVSAVVVVGVSVVGADLVDGAFVVNSESRYFLLWV